jgi:hypothetical protein
MRERTKIPNGLGDHDPVPERPSALNKKKSDRASGSRVCSQIRYRIRSSVSDPGPHSPRRIRTPFRVPHQSRVPIRIRSSVCTVRSSPRIRTLLRMRLVPQPISNRQGGMALPPAFISENTVFCFSTVLLGTSITIQAHNTAIN